MNYAYIIALLCLFAYYAAGILLMKYITSYGVFNLIFVAAVSLPYLFFALIVYLDVGPYDWNFTNVLPTANISPFCFAALPFTLILPEKAKKITRLLISLLSVGMLLSSTLVCISNAAANYAFHPHFMLDYFSHFTLSLYGIFLIRSAQVDLRPKNALISGSVIISVATVMMILNVIFDTAFFGLSLNGRHSIYNNVIVESSYLSALIYYAGLTLLLLLGYLLSKLFAGKAFGINKK